MRRVLAFIIAGVTAVALAGSLSAATAADMPLTIKAAGKLSRGSGSGTFTLAGSSAAYNDSGRFTYRASPDSLVRKTSQGLPYVEITRTETFKGKHGTLVIRSSVQRFDVVKEDDSVSTGTWSIVKGTKRYAGLEGGGALVGITQFSTKASNFSDYVISARYEGLATGG